MFGPLTMVVCLSLALQQSEVGNALSHKLEVGERRSFASHYILTTVWVHCGSAKVADC